MIKKIFTRKSNYVILLAISVLLVIFYFLSPLRVGAATVCELETPFTDSLSSDNGVTYITEYNTTIEKIYFTYHCNSYPTSRDLPIEFSYGRNGSNMTSSTTTLTVPCSSVDDFIYEYDIEDIELLSGELFIIMTDTTDANIETGYVDITPDDNCWSASSIAQPVDNLAGFYQSHFLEISTSTPCEECEECESGGGGGVCEITATSTQQNLIEKITKIEYTYTSSTSPDSVSISEYRIPFFLTIMIGMLCGFVLAVFNFFFKAWNKPIRKRK